VDHGSGGSGAREVLTVNGHASGVTKVRFHPSDAAVLCTAATDKTVRLFDVRNATQRATGRIEVQAGNAPVSVEWSRTSLLAVAERDGSIFVYDTRKLSGAADRGGHRSTPLHTFKIPNKKMSEVCVFSPDGDYLVAEVSADNTGSVQIWPLKDDNYPSTVVAFPAHYPIYSMQFSPTGKILATGGSDACVCVWDADNMSSLYSISRPTKFIRSVAFSHDSKLIATCTEDESIDVADSCNGALVGKVSPGGRRLGVIEEVSWHPKEHLLACARSESSMAGVPATPVALLNCKLTVSVGSNE
jgi:WD40 repeat protein